MQNFLIFHGSYENYYVELNYNFIIYNECNKWYDYALLKTIHEIIHNVMSNRSDKKKNTNTS